VNKGKGRREKRGKCGRKRRKIKDKGEIKT
jgi:hypothetical protein